MLKNLTERRKQRNWSLQETADQLGIAKSTYAGYESGYRTPSLLSLAEIADLFETTVDSLIGRESTKQERIEITDLNFSPYQLSLDQQLLSSDEIIDIIAFLRTKRTLKSSE